MTPRVRALCIGCNKTPEQIEEYWPEFTGEEMNAEDYVWDQEGTLNRANGHFMCTPCYIAAGQPSGPQGWVAP